MAPIAGLQDQLQGLAAEMHTLFILL